MHRLALVFTIAALALPRFAAAAPDGVPARPLTIGNWQNHDPVQPDPGYEPWTPRDAAGFLQLHPDAFLDLGFNDGKPAGHTGWKWRGELVDELQALASQRGVDLRHRICTSDRPDVLTRYADGAGGCRLPSGGGCDWEGDMDGRHGEAETFVKVARRATAGTPDALADTTERWVPEIYAHRLLVLRPGTTTEERRRIVTNQASLLLVDQPWRVPPRPGDAYEVRGSFDPAWVKSAARTSYTSTLQRFWLGTARNCGEQRCNAPAEPLDPFHADNRRGWQPWVSRTVIEALATPTTVPALYGVVLDEGRDPTRPEDPYFAANAVVMDVANPEYRAWRARYLLYKLEDHGVEPGDAACVRISAKPGLHTYYDPAVYGPPTHHCHEQGTNTWAGPAQICRYGETAFGGPFNVSPFDPGEYEAGISAYFRELFATLAANGHADARVVTSETPGIGDRDWAILADDVRRHRMLYGEHGGWIEPALASLAALPAATAVTSQPPAAPASEPAPAPEPTGSTVTTAPTSDATAPSSPTSGGGGGGTTAAGGPSGSGSDAGSASAPTPRRAPRAGFVASSSGSGGGTIEPPQR